MTSSCARFAKPKVGRGNSDHSSGFAKVFLLYPEKKLQHELTPLTSTLSLCSIYVPNTKLNMCVVFSGDPEIRKPLEICLCGVIWITSTVRRLLLTTKNSHEGLDTPEVLLSLLIIWVLLADLQSNIRYCKTQSRSVSPSWPVLFSNYSPAHMGNFLGKLLVRDLQYLSS